MLETCLVYLGFSKDWLSAFYFPRLDLEKGESMKKSVALNFQNIFAYKLSNTVCLHTDGSKIPESEFCGFAVVTEHQSLMFRTLDFVSIFILEAMAILPVLEYCKKSSRKEFSIFSDSRSVLSTLASVFHPSKSYYLILFIKKKICLLKKNDKIIKLFWVPSHAGIPGNEVADSSAKCAYRSGFDSQTCIPGQDFKTLNKDFMFNSLFSFCEHIGKDEGFIYFKSFHFHHRKPWFHGWKASRKATVSISRIRSHTFLNESRIVSALLILLTVRSAILLKL